MAKQYCVKGHDTYLAGRDNGGHCRICCRLKSIAWGKKNPARAVLATKKWRHKNRDKFNMYRKTRRYGLTESEYNNLLLKQDYKCCICKADLKDPANEPYIDHDHVYCNNQNRKTCGKCIRGILCGMCNRGLGAFKDNITTLARTIEYLTEWSVNKMVH